MKIRKQVSVVLIGAMAAALSACSQPAQETTSVQTTQETTSVQTTQETAQETTPAQETISAQPAQMSGKVTLAAAASLEKSFTEKLIPMFNQKYPEIAVEGTYDSSGKLQTQIEEGADVDVFFSAALKQMNALKDEGLMNDDSIVELLENKIVLIVPAGEESGYSKFEDIVNADMIALGDPESVPAGQYAKEAYTNLGLWDKIEPKTSFGTNVTEVLNWVSEKSANAGVVYATDAAKMPDSVSVIAASPKGSTSPVIYPVGITKASNNTESAKIFIDFLQSEEAMKVFTDNGFSAAE